MSGKPSPILPSNVAAGAVERWFKSGRPVVDRIEYVPSDNTVIIACGPLSLHIDANRIVEFVGLSKEDLAGIGVSAAGSTIKIESKNIYIEAYSLVYDLLSQVYLEGEGGIILEILSNQRTNFS